MQLKAQSEWMLDQKQAQVMGPGKAFQVMQTVEGTSVFFSISTDNRLYATREVPTGFPGTGWSRIDLCAGILGPQEPRPPTIKSFALGQNPDSLAFDLAVVISIPGKSGDKLYISTGNANTDDAWSRSNSRLGVQWKAVPFDAINSTVDPDKLEIDGVYLMTLPSASSAAGSLTCFVDTLRGTPATNTLRLLDRYYITVGARRAWNKHTLPIDLQADSISSSLGRRFKDRVGGIYTFGDINGRLELIYAPAYDYWNEDNPPSPVRFGLPEQATSMTTCPNSNGNSHLFVSGKQGIFHWAPDQQKDGSTGTRIITTTLVAEAKHLSSETLGNVTALYGISPQGDLFYTTCKVGSEGSAHAWSLPIPLISGVEEYSFFLNKKTEKTTAFAHTTGQHVTQLTQDPVTHDWSSRSILLPSTDVDDVVDLSAFTTRVTVQNDAGGPGAGVDVLFSATSPVAVYINDSYRILRPSLNIKATADSAGTITIVQPTQDMSAVCYKASLASNPSNSLDIDPASKVKSRIASISSGKDLKTATVTRSDGTTSPLLSSDVSEEDCNAAASAIQQLVKVAATLPQDGGMKATPNAKSDQAQVLAITTCQKDAYFSLASGPSSGSSATGISISAGDLFRFLLHSAWSAVKRFVIRVADGIYEVLVHIGDVIYHAALDCVAAVTHAVEWVFTQLKVAFETIRDFLGFVFNWGDIVRTHKVIKNVATQYAHYGLSRIGKLQDLVSVSADTLEETLNNWAGIPDKEVTAAESNRKAAEKSSTYSDPQTHYVQDKVKSNMANAKSDAKATDVDMPGDWGSILSELKDMAVDEQKTVANSLEEIKTQIIDGFGTLTPLEIVKRLVAIVGKLVIETARNVVVKTLGIVKSLTKSVLDELNTPISIPVVSKLYKFIAHDELSIMDLVCLVAAVPATIVFKAVIGSNPFPDNSATTALIEASDFAAVQKLLQNDQSVYKTLTIVSEFAAMAGLGFTVIANTIKIPQMTKGKPHEVPDKVKQASIPIKLLVLMPGLLRQRSSNDPWYFQMDAILTDMAFLKVCLDSTSLGEKEMYGTVSPYIDFAISALWIVPSIGKIAANHAKTSSYMSLTRSLAYDVAVMTGPIVWSPSLDPETKLIMLVVGDGLIVITAGVSVATGRLLQDGD